MEKEFSEMDKQYIRDLATLDRLENTADFLFEQQKRNDYNEYLKHCPEWDNETMSYTEFKRKWRK